MKLQDNVKILTGQIFDIHLCSASCDLQTLNEFCLLQGVNWQSCTGIFYCHCWYLFCVWM